MESHPDPMIPNLKRSNIKLTDSRILALRPGPTVLRTWDSIVSGFHVRVTPAGSKSFCVTFQRGDGKKVNVTIGACGSWSTEDAREKARELRKLHDEGRDARAHIQSERKVQDLAALIELWRRDYKSKLRSTTQVSYESLLKSVILPALGSRFVKDLTYEDVKTLHRKEAREHPTNANRAIAVLSRLLSIAEKEGWRPFMSNPCGQVEKPTLKPRQRVLSASEYAQLESAMQAQVTAKKLDPAVADWVRFLALSGLRKSEALGLRWTDVDLERNTMRFEEHKTSKQAGTKVLPLNSHLREIIQRRTANKLSAYVWPGISGDQPLVGLAKMWARICEIGKDEGTNLVDVTPHDLRRTFMTTCTELGYPAAIGDALLGHSLGRIRDTYVNLGTEGIMATASQETADWIAAALRGESPKPGVKTRKEKASGNVPA